MKIIRWLKTTPRNQGIALVLVVGALALITVLLLAMFSSTETEYRSTQGYVAAQSAKQLADMSVEIVKSQIQDAQSTTTTGTTHATQPGCVQVFSAAGDFSKALKLYSSSTMVETNADSLLRDVAPADWNSTTNRARYVDLNEPVERKPLNNGATPAIFFPVIDPRAAYDNFSNGGVHAVDGFSYDHSTKWGEASVTYGSGAGVVTPADGASPTDLRLAMPVEWIYILKDGTMGTLDSSFTFVPAPGATGNATADNPIVGRIAFWADDESCKININTASEPTYMGTPFYYHDRDRLWAHYPAATGEYQRYPGHPATVALSAVIFPGFRLDPYNPDTGATRQEIRDLKDAIYRFMPKVTGGTMPQSAAGSESGTLPFVLDDFSSARGDTLVSSHVDMTSARYKRLLPSVDEMLFKDADFSTATGRSSSVISATFMGQTRTLLDHDTLEHSRFFLTAHSRSPEFSIHGFPRICMWPVADESWPNTHTSSGVPNTGRTSFDNIIALSASVKKGTNGQPSTYYIRRLDPHSATADVTGTLGGLVDASGNSHNDASNTLTRNNNLIQYMAGVLNNIPYPGTGLPSGATTLGAKYGNNNANQLAIEAFDYIRCTNLYDGILARSNNGQQGMNNQKIFGSNGGFNPGYNWPNYYDLASGAFGSRYTYTEQRASLPASGTNTDKTGNDQGSGGGGGTSKYYTTQQADQDARVYVGHGTVTPAQWTSGGNTYMGFGRFITLSEIGLHFICTADGANDQYAVGNGTGNGFKAPFSKLSGGTSAPMADPTKDIGRNSGSPVYMANAQAYGLVNMPGNANARWYSNFPPVDETRPGYDGLVSAYGVNVGAPADPQKNPQHPFYHPGFNPKYWNMTLEENTPLQPNERRVQANIDLETFCPMSGWTKFFPEFTISLDPTWVAQIKVVRSDGVPVPLFDSTAGFNLKSYNNLYETGNAYPLGGNAGPASISGGRSVRAIAGDSKNGRVRMGSDPNYVTTVSGPRSDLINYNLCSNFVTVRNDQALQVVMPTTPLGITIYDSHLVNNSHKVQTLSIQFPTGTMQLPPPILAQPNTVGINFRSYLSGTTMYYARSLQGPHWWCFNLLGAVNRYSGTVNKGYVKGKGPLYAGTPTPVPYNAPGTQVTRGRLDTTNGTSATAGGVNPPANSNAAGTYGLVPDAISDTIRSMIPAIGDYRMVAARATVPVGMWMLHPMWDAQKNRDWKSQLRTIHSYTEHAGDSEAGYLLAVDPAWAGKVDPVTGAITPPVAYKPAYSLVSGAYDGAVNPSNTTEQHGDNRMPDLPGQAGWAAAANSFGDFDTGIGNEREGAYVNKPDEGNYYAATDLRNYGNQNHINYYLSGYFFNSWRQTDDWRNGIFMTPNRLISSPVMMGSLPTGIWNGNGAASGTQPSSTYATNVAIQGQSFNPSTVVPNSFPSRPWQTLLFRPHVPLKTSNGSIASKPFHPGQYNPPDHSFLDLFYMPVVEPYAISEPLSISGRLNMNYQILPFTHIRRATAMHALMKGEFMTAIPRSMIVPQLPSNMLNLAGNGQRAAGVIVAKVFKAFTPQLWDQHWTEKAVSSGDTSDSVYWHRPINVERTLDQFDERFRRDTGISVVNQKGIFRSASQICEVSLIPSLGQGETGAPSSLVQLQTQTNAVNRPNLMSNFWTDNPATGDNVRERPYSNLYARLTTRSDTFRVHMRAQVVVKARSTKPNTFVPDTDSVTSEYRGSAVVERYIDPNDTSTGYQIPDYADGGSISTKPSLETFYKFRVIETKRFNP